MKHTQHEWFGQITPNHVRGIKWLQNQSLMSSYPTECRLTLITVVSNCPYWILPEGRVHFGFTVAPCLAYIGVQ